ncbi:hypothetical protein CERSUDRAFT_104116 [Gelatoporia subvermispora B]|uniref:NAD-P-binding protein n=1 Tax=Ceriporiopsis subvermispora (strain B) TaxID=914234 RepID=M2RJY8_CERS8|nr:hypothetical protein CERSUDRAFT_104116 [Gelatoporia subvermispora B]
MLSSNSTPKVWFITGASTGFGRMMTELVLKNGDIAVATLRKPEVLAELTKQYPPERLLVLKLDVKSPGEVHAAFAKTRDVFGRLDVLFNNAACVLLSEVESAMGHDDMAHDIFEVNFWGAVHVTQAAVKFFREVNKPGVGGRILQMSSIAGFEGSPVAGFYSASKHALEGISEALAREIDPNWNIKVTFIEPGPFRTGATANFVIIPQNPAYKDAPASAMRSLWAGLEDSDVVPVDDPWKAVDLFYRLARLPEPPLRFPVGKTAVDALKKKAVSLLADAEAYASWSENMRSEVSEKPVIVE